MKIWLGTTNPGKRAEMAALLGPLGVELGLADTEEVVEETGETFTENAHLKAREYARRTGGWTLSEDSGLVVPALHGQPGPCSARFAERDPAVKARQLPRAELDRLNNELVLELMRAVPQPGRAATFVVVLTLATPAEILFTAQGECHGWLAEEARGDGGFGYDSIFVGQDTFGKTFAELDAHRKNLRSHRRRVLDELLMWVSQRL